MHITCTAILAYDLMMILLMFLLDNIVLGGLLHWHKSPCKNLLTHSPTCLCMFNSWPLLLAITTHALTYWSASMLQCFGQSMWCWQMLSLIRSFGHIRAQVRAYLNIQAFYEAPPFSASLENP